MSRIRKKAIRRVKEKGINENYYGFNDEVDREVKRIEEENFSRWMMVMLSILTVTAFLTSVCASIKVISELLN